MVRPSALRIPAKPGPAGPRPGSRSRRGESEAELFSRGLPHDHPVSLHLDGDLLEGHRRRAGEHFAKLIEPAVVAGTMELLRSLLPFDEAAEVLTDHRIGAQPL